MKIEVFFILSHLVHSKLMEFNVSGGIKQQNGKTTNCLLFSVGGYNFALLHGYKNGKVDLNGYEISTEKLLSILIPKMKESGVKEVQTISCYGGYQPVVEKDGYRISSFHPSHAPVIGSVYSGMRMSSFEFDLTNEEAETFLIKLKMMESTTEDIFYAVDDILQDEEEE